MMYRFNMKHLYAYSSLGGVVSHETAEKNVMNQKFYYDEEKTCELILKDGSEKAKHFAFKRNAEITVNGESYAADAINESPAHFNLKMRIKKYEYFLFGGNTIRVKNVKLEFVESTFRYDLKAELHCGTPCVIEIIRTSKTALKKESYLREKQILTFEIFIDKDGIQNVRQFNLYGNEQLEQVIRERIASENRVKAIQNGLYSQKERERRIINSEVDERITELENEIQLEAGMLDYLKDEGSEHYKIQQGQLKQIKQVIELCREARKEINESEVIYRESRQRIKDETESEEEINERINKLKIEVEQRKREFEKACKRCRIEWYVPKWMKKENTLREFKYWTT